MTTREKVILGFTAVAAIGAGVYYASGLFSSSEPIDQPVRKDFTALITSVQLNLNKGELTDREENILSATSTEWSRNPLRVRPLFPHGDGSSPAIPLPTYMGFINTGSEPIAIINGIDYRPGETVQGGEFQVAQIYPEYVELLRRGATDPVDVPIEKTETEGQSK